MKRKLTVLFAAVLTLCLSFTACETVQEKTPELTITSAVSAEITTDESYLLAYNVSYASGGVAVTVTKQGGGEGGVYDQETKTFTASAEGVYTLTVTATNVEKTDVKTVTVTVTLAALPDDTEAPVITFAEGKLDVYVGNVNTEITLPSATAADVRDGDLTAALDVAPVNASGITFNKLENNTYSFNSAVAGSHRVSYYVEDAAGNDAEEFITVNVAPLVAESVVEEGFNNITNLDTSSLTYEENFEKGYSSDLVKGLNAGAVEMSVEGGENAMAGNSLVFDYSDCLYNTNTSIYFGAINNYIKAGRWTIEFDVKKLSGNVPDFYISFVFDGDVSGDNTGYSINSENGSVTHVSFNQIKYFDSTKDWMFRIFTYTGSSAFQYDGLKLVLDNFKITWKEVVDATVVRTQGVTLSGSDLDGSGTTLTGADDNYSALGGTGGGQWVQTDKLVSGDLLTAEQAANITAGNGFNSGYAIRFTTQINNIEALKNLLTDSTYDYTITLKVYAPAQGSWYMFFTDGSGAQSYAKGMTDTAGVKTWTHTVQGNAAYANIGLYTGGNAPILIGDITVSRVEHQSTSTTPNGYEVGKTWTFTADQMPTFGGTVEGTKIATSSVAALSGLEGFEGENVRYYNVAVNNSMGLFYNVFETGAKYKITLYYYVVSWEGRSMLNFDNSSFTDIGGGNTAGYHKSVVTDITGKNFTMLFNPDGAAEFYLAKVVVELTNIG